MQTGQPIRQQAARQLNFDTARSAPPIRPPYKRRGLARLRTVLGMALILLIGVAVAGGVVFWKKAGNVGGKKGAKSVIESLINPRGQFPHQSRVNILLIGKDYDYVWGVRDKTKNGFRTTKSSRSDTIAMVSLDMEHGKVSMLSIPRDTLVTAPETPGSSTMVKGKINATYRRGGYPLLRDTVENLLGVKPDHYIAVKPDALKNIVDALGGVEVETIDRLNYVDWGARLFIDLPKGKQVITGEQAIGFARYREPDTVKRNPDHSPIPLPGSHDQFYHKSKHEIIHSLEEGEPRRMARQQQLIRAMTHKAQSFQNLLKLDDLVNLGLEQIDTDLDRTQVFALVALFRGIKPDQIQSATLKGHGTLKNLYFFYPDEEKKQYMVDWLLRGDESAANHVTVVEVQNGTDVTGAGLHLGQTLREQGYDIRSAANANRGEGGHEIEKTQVVYYAASVAVRAERIARLIGAGAPVKQPRPPKAEAEDFDDEPVDVTIVLGRDLAGSFQSH